MASEHIVSSYDDELTRLNDTVGRMGGMAEAILSSAVLAVIKRDSELAGRTVESDAQVDELENDVADLCIKLFALRQPMAMDLREIVSALKISSDIERIADYGANIAKRAIALSQTPPVKPVHAIPRMARLAQAMIKDVLDAYLARDAEKALEVWERDEEVDEMYTSLFRELLTYMMEDPRNITPCTHLLFIAKNIERIGDHATNIAETIYFLVHGSQLDQIRPKGDTSSMDVVVPPKSSNGTSGEANGLGEAKTE